MRDDKTNTLELFIYKTKTPDKEVDVISFLPTTEVFKNGLTNKNIVGSVINASAPLNPENIQFNSAFIDLFQHIVRITSISIESLHNAATRQGSGYIYIIDQRDKNYPNTKSVDIIGSFQVTEGAINSDSYQPNENYQIISIDGPFKLPAIYEQNLLTAMQH